MVYLVLRPPNFAVFDFANIDIIDLYVKRHLTANRPNTKYLLDRQLATRNVSNSQLFTNNLCPH